MKLWSLYITQNVYHGFFQFIAIICFTFYNKRDKKTEHDRKRININTFSVPQIFVNPSSSQPLSINPSFFVCFVAHGRKYQLSNPFNFTTPICKTSVLQATYFNRIVKLWNFTCKSVPKSSLSCIDVSKNFKTNSEKHFTNNI